MGRFNKYIPWILMVATIVIALVAIQNFNEKLKEKENLIEGLGSELKTWKDLDSLNYAKIVRLETERVKDFIKLETQDSIVRDLQETVKKYKKKLDEGSSVTNISTNTDVAGTSTTTVIPRDTIEKYIYPEYRSNFNFKGWVTGTTIANRDSTSIDFNIKNEYSVILGYDKKNLFSRKIPFVEVLNKNPYTETTALRTYQVTIPKPKKFGVGPIGAYGVTLTPIPSPTWFIGFGVQYTLFRF